MHVITDQDLLDSVAADASQMPGGHAAGLVVACAEADVAALLRSGARVLPIGAQSSVTGGATPMGEVVLSLARLDRILDIGPMHARVQAGVTLSALDAALAARGLRYPPAPTFHGATIGGTVATNAAGAATFKYGTTRDWVQAMTVVLPSGDVLKVARGEHRASGGRLLVPTSSGAIEVRVPRYRLPHVPKRSAGYHAAPDMDLIDLFIGAEGTLGVVTEITLRVVPAPAICLALVPCPSFATALDLVEALRNAARDTWHSGNPQGLDISAIEQMDARSIAILREDAAEKAHGLTIPASARTLLLVQIELPPSTTADEAYAELGSASDAAARGPLVRFSELLEDRGLLDDVQVAVPGERHRAAQLIALREAVPAGVNHRVAIARRDDARISKTAADMIVPFERFGEMMRLYDERLGSRGLDYAIWGHSSDGNVHPNVLPRSFADVEAGREAILELGRDAVRLGGSPLAEHGVGRNPIKQQLLSLLYGREGVADMVAVKRALDPGWRLAPGVIFE